MKKNVSALLMVFFMLLFIQSMAQTSRDWVVIDEIADEIVQLNRQYEGRSNVFHIKGVEQSALLQVFNAIEDADVHDLHLYVPTKPGSIVFNTIALTPDNVDDFSDELSGWKTRMDGRVVIHSNVVFTGEEGDVLKRCLEKITGLEFIMDSSI